jgi:ribosomal protein S18 acetylase RimI-like enzyme
MLTFGIRYCKYLYRALYRKILIRYWYRIQLQSVASLSPESHLELQMLLREVHGVCIDPLRVLQETDELYTVMHENNIVACVFIKTVDWCVAAKPNIVTSTPYSHPEDDGNQMLRFCDVRALSVSPQHRRLGLASRLLELIKEKAAADRMLWIELHVDEKKDMSHRHLLSMYRELGFMVLPRPNAKEYLLICVNYS